MGGKLSSDSTNSTLRILFYHAFGGGVVTRLLAGSLCIAAIGTAWSLPDTPQRPGSVIPLSKISTPEYNDGVSHSECF